MDYNFFLKNHEIRVSVPCRIDLGGTLDITTFSLPLNHLDPSTFNIALDMRTYVRLSAWKKGYVKIFSRGFKSAEFEAGHADFDHPLGLMFAVAAFFNAQGVCIEIDSTSPPRSALGGSSAAAVAIVAAFLKMQQSVEYKKLLNGQRQLISQKLHTAKNGYDCGADCDKSLKLDNAPVIAHYIEAGVAGVPCGFQDQLAAAYGGVNSWHWILAENGPSFIREKIFCDQNIQAMKKFNNNILVAYCGIPHASKDINKKWVDMFIAGKNRDKWAEICRITKDFSQCITKAQYDSAGVLMNRETKIRLEMTPDVLDETGKKLFKAAEQSGCGARFTGAGGGGCLWAVGESDKIDSLKEEWEKLTAGKDQAILLDTQIDPDGILFE